MFTSTQFAALCFVLKKMHLFVVDNVQIIEFHSLHEPRLKMSDNINMFDFITSR